MAFDRSKRDPLLMTLFDSKPRKGDLRKVEIIQAAIELVATSGVESASYDAIGEIVGIRRSNVAYYFKSKDEVLDTVFQYVFAKIQEQSVKSFEGLEKGRELLKAYVYGNFEWIRLYPDHVSVILLFYYYTSINKKYRQMHAEVQEAGTSRLVAILMKEDLLGDDESSAKVRTLARGIQSQIMGAMIFFMTTVPKGDRSAADRSKRELFQAVLGRLEPVP